MKWPSRVPEREMASSGDDAGHTGPEKCPGPSRANHTG